jgi:hypothetical protein
MTNRNKRRRSGYREPRPASMGSGTSRPAARPGLLTSMFSARAAGTSNMPRVRSSLLRGIAVTAGTPVLLVGTVVLVLVAWIAALSFGYQGPVPRLASMLAMPPVGTLFDLQFTAAVFGVANGPAALLGMLPFAIARSVVTGVIFGLAVEVLDTGRPSLSGARRGFLVSPMVLIVTVIQLGFFIVAGYIGPLIPGLGLFVVLGTVTAAVYLLAYAPIAQLREGRGVLESLSLASRAARIPGTSSLAMALFFTVPAIAIEQTPLGGFGVNPSPLAWAFVLVVNLLHVSVMVTFAYRWMCIEDEVPDSAARARSGRRSSDGRSR